MTDVETVVQSDFKKTSKKTTKKSKKESVEIEEVDDQG